MRERRNDTLRSRSSCFTALTTFGLMGKADLDILILSLFSPFYLLQKFSRQLSN